VLLVHGFGANADHWRKNTPVIGEWGRAFAIDLLGYGYSDKPDPTTQEKNTIYNFETWAGTFISLGWRGWDDKLVLYFHEDSTLAHASSEIKQNSTITCP
jgi:pimeloyl-ACP methyl ester carboxylesterase